MAWLRAELFGLVGIGLALWARRNPNPESPMDDEPESRHRLFPRLWRRRDQRLGQPAAEPVPPLVVVSLAEPDAVRALADEFGDHFKLPELKAPLRRFLNRLRSRQFPSLQGVAIAAWDVAPDPSYLAIYALIDETAQTGTVTRATVTAVLGAHEELNEQLRAEHSSLSCSLWFVDTQGQDLAALGSVLDEYVGPAGDLFAAVRPGTERIARLRVAKAA